MSNTGRLITMDKEKASYSTTILPQSSLAAAPHTPLEWVVWKMEMGKQ